MEIYVLVALSTLVAIAIMISIAVTNAVASTGSGFEWLCSLLAWLVTSGGILAIVFYAILMAGG